MALRLHAITSIDPHHGAAAESVDGASVVSFRDLGAIVSEQKTFAVPDAGDSGVDAHRTIVDTLFRRGPVLPVPYGVVFREKDVLTRWMELHYVALCDALAFVEDRAVARVHIERANGKPEERETGSDLAATAAEMYRVLRRKAVASVPLTVEQVTGIVLSAAFLVERELWKEFVAAVDEQREAHEDLHLDVTGPWAAYDFVRMDFGA
jgi:hypothetical protein